MKCRERLPFVTTILSTILNSKFFAKAANFGLEIVLRHKWYEAATCESSSDHLASRLCGANAIES